MRLLGRRAREAGRAYLVGGACAVLFDWRATTIDIDLELEPSLEPLLRDLPEIKEALQVNVELASPAHFIPALPGWRERSPFIVREGLIDSTTTTSTRRRWRSSNAPTPRTSTMSARWRSGS